jgi:RimJ/RimL family protein N-acetyltransferase
MTPLRSERLTAEPISRGHLAELCRMHSDARVMATLGGLRSDAASAAFLTSSIEHWQKHGYGLWVWRDPTNGAFVGRAGLRHTLVEDKPEVELAYALVAEYWGRGLATEIGRALLALGQESLGLGGIVAFTLTTNRGSQNVMQKLGMQYERDIVHHDLPHVLYRTVR